MKSGWMKWSQKDHTDSLDLTKLEELFCAEEKDEKKPLPSTLVHCYPKNRIRKLIAGEVENVSKHLISI